MATATTSSIRAWWHLARCLACPARSADQPDAPLRRAREDPAAPCPDPIMYMSIDNRWHLREPVRVVGKATLLERESLCCVICDEPWEGLTAGDVRLLVGGDEEAVERAMADAKTGVCTKPVILSCGHLFGALCLAAWLTRNRSCPMCKKVVQIDLHVTA